MATEDNKDASESVKQVPITADEIDLLINNAVFNPDDSIKRESRDLIKKLALSMGIYPASIQPIYDAAGKGLVKGITVPAINIRGITYQVARAIFRVAMKNNVGAFIFEIARSEMGYTYQAPDEYVAAILTAALRENFRGPVFIQGDHFQVKPSRYSTEPDAEINDIKSLIDEAVKAGFLNIDVDASTVVDLNQPTIDEQQANNYTITADMTRLIREIQPRGTIISVGGEIGEVGTNNTTVEELRTFMAGYMYQLETGITGISKISVQNGTTHGGLVLPDGSIKEVQLNFENLRRLSRVAREEYGMGGVVQHGASTLPIEAFDMFPANDAIEVHLATEFQNIIYDSPYFPVDLLDSIYQYLKENHIAEKKADDTDKQFLYKTRKKAWGAFKHETWNLPDENMQAIITALENQFEMIFKCLNVVNTVGIVDKYILNPNNIS